MKEIFILEDDNDIRDLIEFLLVNKNYKVTTFATAEAFCKEVEVRHPDLFLLDIMLPDGNGADICIQIKSEKSTAMIPVILMSAHVDPKITRVSCADDFIPKPFDIEEFTSRISRQLN